MFRDVFWMIVSKIMKRAGSTNKTAMIERIDPLPTSMPTSLKRAFEEKTHNARPAIRRMHAETRIETAAFDMVLIWSSRQPRALGEAF